MQRKRTFMTAPDMIVDDDDEDQPIPAPVPFIESPTDIFDEYNSMLKDVLDAQKVVRGGTDDLAELRKMIHKTRVNMDQHIAIVDNLKSNLETIQEKSKQVIEGKKTDYYQSEERTLNKLHRNVQSHKQLPKKTTNMLSATKSTGKLPQSTQKKQKREDIE